MSWTLKEDLTGIDSLTMGFTMSGEAKKDLEIIPTQNMLDDLRVLLNLKASQLTAFAEAVNSEDGFGIPTEANLAQLIRRVSMTGDEFEQVYRISKFLYDRMAEKESGFSDLFEAIQVIAQEHSLPPPSRKRVPLQKLFSVPSHYRKKKKAESYRQGIVHGISAIASTHEVRAVFGDGPAEEAELLGYVPVVSVRLVAEDDEENRKSLLFSVDDKSLEKVIGRLSEIKNELERVKKHLLEKGVELL